MEFAALIDRLLRFYNETQAELGKRYGTDQSTISRWLSGKMVPTQFYHDIVVADGKRVGILDSNPPKLLVPVVGSVGLGWEISSYAEPSRMVEIPENATGLVAVEAMRDIYQPGDWLLFYKDGREPPHKGLIGKLCVVGLADGRRLARYLHPGRQDGRWDLHGGPSSPMLDQDVVWASKVLYTRQD